MHQMRSLCISNVSFWKENLLLVSEHLKVEKNEKKTVDIYANEHLGECMHTLMLR